ncbi:hypothetical protein C0Z19_21510 [Trinickia soli]|uniref:Transposase Tn5 dimerisation domain-containing protein n=1 Tax=Trinickia soli TaxID=380675 RepID=A0A2N7VPZ5_9BURK|nr:hypothetical protein C0Z19_21510 [Trinickia soli]
MALDSQGDAFYGLRRSYNSSAKKKRRIAAREFDGEPGVKTIWLGMQRVVDFAAGIRYARELERQTCV